MLEIKQNEWYTLKSGVPSLVKRFANHWRIASFVTKIAIRGNFCIILYIYYYSIINIRNTTPRLFINKIQHSTIDNSS